MGYIKEQFVEGRFTSAKALIMDCVVVAQNRNCILLLEKANYSEREIEGGSRIRGCLLKLNVFEIEGGSRTRGMSKSF